MREGFRPTVVRVFGGLVSFIDRIALSLGLSPRAEDVRFASGMVGSRDGYKVAAVGPAGASLVDVSQYVAQDGASKLLFLGTGGAYGGQVFAQSSSTPWEMTVLEDQIDRFATKMRTASMFGRQYLCFSNGKTGLMPMYRYDGTSLSLVGCGAPGKAPTIASSAAASGTGGSLDAGKHSCVVVFVNKAGDVSGWSPVGVTASDLTAGKQVAITVPLGPPDTAQRIIAITPVNDARNFLYTAKTIISENTTDSAISIDISEDELVSSQLSVSRWLTSFVPWMPLGVESVQERTMVWGSRAVLQPGVRFDGAVDPYALQNVGIRNLSFDGGFGSGGAAEGLPNGWTAAAGVPGMGGSKGGASMTDGTSTPFYGKCYRIYGGDQPVGDLGGTEPWQGKITQTVKSDSDYLRAKGNYVVVFALRHSAGIDISSLAMIHLTISAEPSLGDIFSRDIFVNEVNSTNPGAWGTTTRTMNLNLSKTPTQLTVSLYGQTGTNRIPVGEWVDIRIAIYDTEDQQHLHTINASDSGRPGTFVGATCAVSVGPDDGEGIRNVFCLRDNVYVAKERSLHALSNTTAGEPVTWAVALQDDYAGTPSVHGVAVGNGYAAIANRAGLFLFDGASPRLVSREIRPNWIAAAWGDEGEDCFVALDPSEELVYVGLPQAGGTAKLAVLDFKEGWDSPVPSGSGLKWATHDFVTRSGVADKNYSASACSVVIGDNGVYRPVLLVASGTVNAIAAAAAAFTSPTWTFTGSPTVTTGQGDGMGGTTAVRWVSAGAMTATVAAPSGTSATNGLSISFRVYGTAPTVTFSRSPLVTRVDSDGSPWCRVVAHFSTIDTATASPGTITLSWGSATDIRMADIFVCTTVAPRDTGYSPPGGDTDTIAVSPVSGLRYDFSGRIPAVYETAPFGEELGRSTFDTCLIRARGSGLLTAQYTGIGSRNWAMTSVQLSENPDEDIEFGANLQAPAASLVIGLSGYGAWFIVNRVGVANKGETIGWARGRNG